MKNILLNFVQKMTKLFIYFFNERIWLKWPQLNSREIIHLKQVNPRWNVLMCQSHQVDSYKYFREMYSLIARFSKLILLDSKRIY